MILNNPKVTKQEMAKAIGKSTKTVQRIIKNLKYIIYLGSMKKGNWKIVNENMSNNT